MDEQFDQTPAQAPEDQPSVGSFLWDLVKVVLVAFGIMIVFRFFVAEPFVVSGKSMEPNFHDNEYLIINKVGYRIGEPQRGDAIVFHYPKERSQYFIKRIVGLPGEKVKVEDGRVLIYNEEYPQGRVLNEPYTASQNVTFGPNEVISLGSEEYFVLGDNRLQSSDSRVWGILPKKDIVGKAFVRIFPFNELGVIKSATY
jgi:signal peptidase I